MSANDSQKTGRLRLRHLLETTEARAAEMADQRPRFDRLANKESAPRVVSSFNLFQTPEAIADKMAALLRPEGRILEPSAGLGRLYRAVRYRSDCPMVLVEVSPDCCAELYRETEHDQAARLVSGDFLECTADRLGGVFDRIIMNPPFKLGTDVKHIQHARELLAPGGRLVALCYNGTRQRAVLKPIADHWEELPEGAFKSEGTRAAVVLMVIEN